MEARIHDNLADALKAQGRTAEAVEAWRRSVALNPENRDALDKVAAATQ